MNIVNLYFMNHNKITQDTLEAQLRTIAPHYGNAILTVKNEKRKVELLCSGVLLKEHLGITSDSQFKVSESGCLFLADDTRGFCISHARDFTILAVSEDGSTIGADIEEISDDRFEKAVHHRAIVAKRVFPPALMAQYKAATLEEEPTVFAALWTQVEAVLKADGAGFYKEPLKHPELFSLWQCQNIIYQDHMIAIASKDPVELKLNPCASCTE